MNVIELRNPSGAMTTIEQAGYRYHLYTEAQPIIWRFDRHADHLRW